MIDDKLTVTGVGVGVGVAGVTVTVRSLRPSWLLRILILTS